MSQSRNRLATRISQWDWDKCQRPTWYRILFDPRPVSLIPTALVYFVPALLILRVNGTTDPWAWFAMAIATRWFFGFIHVTCIERRLLLQAFAPLEHPRLFSSSWRTVIHYQVFLAVEAVILCHTLFGNQDWVTVIGKSVLYLASIITSLILTKWAIVIFRAPNVYPTSKRNFDLSTYLPDSHKRTRIGIKWFDRWYFNSLTPEQKSTTNILFPDDRWRPSQMLLMGWALVAIPTSLFWISFLYVPSKIVQVLAMMIAIVLSLTGNIILPSFGSYPIIQHQAVPFHYSSAFSALVKLSWRRWLVGWGAAAVFGLTLTYVLGSEPLLSKHLKLLLVILCSGFAITLTSISYRLAVPKGFRGKRASRWTQWAIAGALPLIAVLFSGHAVSNYLSDPPEAPLPPFTLAACAIVTSIAFHILHRQGWKRSWYDV